MRFGHRPWTVVAVALSSILVLKMVLLEPVEVAAAGMRMVLVASLLPVALLLGRAGVPVISAGCGLAHWVNHGDLPEAMVAAVSVAAATGIALLVLRPRPSPLGWVAAGWVMTLVLSASMAVGRTLMSATDLLDSFLTVVSGVWLSINLVGVPVSMTAWALIRRAQASGRESSEYTEREVS